MRGLVLIIIGVLGLGSLHAQTPASTAIQPPTPSTQKDALGPAFRSACWSGDLNKVTLLFNEGAPLEGRDNLGRTPLFLACHGDPDVVKFLLAHGARIDAAENDGDLPIAHACEFGDLASAQMLLDAGADFSRVNQYGHTPLMLAAREGHDALVSLLISHHVDVNFEGISDPALFFAVGNDHLSTAKLLLDAGARVTRSPESANLKHDRPSLLTSAAWTGDWALIDLLLAHGVDINNFGEEGRTTLIAAVQWAKPEASEYLLEKGADPNLQDNEGETALMRSINYQQEPVLQKLLDHGAKLEIKDKEGRTALIWACYYAYDPLIRFLIDHGADINAADLKGETPLIYAGDRGDLEMVQLLKDKGAKRTDLHIIAKEKPSQPLPPIHSWALAVGAIYPQTNGTSPQILGYGTPDTVEEIQNDLKRDWGITDEASFFKEIRDLIDNGHHVAYQAAGAQLAVLSESEFVDKLASLAPDAAYQAKALRASYLKWKERTGLAWDLCRAANLINLGYQAHYLDEQEAWHFLMPIARQTQRNFSSWQEMSDNFLDGREIWANQRDPRFEACAQLLLNAQDPNSPWNQNPWQTDLSSN